MVKEERASHIPPAWLAQARATCVGKKATFVEPVKLPEASFYRRCLKVVADVKCRRTVVQVPQEDSLFQALISPDLGDEEVLLARVRMPASLSRLLMSYPCQRSWELLGVAVLTFIKTEGLPLDSQFYLFIAKSEELQGLLNSVVRLADIRPMAERLIRDSQPIARWEDALAAALTLVTKDALVVNRYSDRLVFCLADSEGMEASKICAAEGYAYSVHGLWLAAHHDSPRPVCKLDPVQFLCPVLLPLLIHDVFKEVECHAAKRFSDEEGYFKAMNMMYDELQTADCYVMYLVVARHGDDKRHAIQQVGFSLQPSPCEVEGLKKGGAF